MKQIDIEATVAKTSADAKKATVVLELDYESWEAMPELVKITGETVSVAITAADDGR